jgi:acetate kinase
MGGIDALVFTGGVGENSTRVRTAAADATGFLGIELDQRRNAEAKGDVRLSWADAAVPVLTVEAREDLEIAAQVRAMLSP